MVRRLDHCVLPTASLGVARERLTALGFTVAPQGMHPFGTANACVYFADGTFLEMLAVYDPIAVADAILDGNVFVSHDAAYRRDIGHEGFSALVLASDDADADHAGFVSEGLSAGPRLDFSRPFVDATGETDIASFRLAFAKTDGAPDALFFTCQRANVPQVDRAALTRHANGATRMASIISIAAQPEAFRDALAMLTDADAEPIAGGFRYALGQAELLLLEPVAAARDYSVEVEGSGLQFRAIMFSVGDLIATEAALSERNIVFRRVANGLVVPPETGQGAAFLFR